MTTSPAITAWRHQAPALDIAVDEARPWVMPLVLRVERGVDISHQEALTTAAVAVVRLMADEKSAPTGEWHDSLATWMQGRIRKVVRRARASKWEAVVSSVPGLVVQRGNVEIFVGVPHPADQTPADLSRLQVSGLDLPSTSTDPLQLEPVLHIAVNPALKMSTGKAMAQVGHAAQLALLQLSEPVVARWSDHFSVEVSLGESDFFEAPEGCIEVEDAGFTEIPAGSLTTKAWFV